MQAGSLSASELKKFHTDGCLLVDNFLTHSECDILKDACLRVIRDADLSEHAQVTFDSVNDKKLATEEYLLTSGDKVRFFFEKGVFNSDGQLNCPKERSVNKLGHALHDLIPEFKQVTYSEKVKNLARSLKLKKPAIIQSMYIFKQPKIGGTVTPHRDSTFMDTYPALLYGVWIALEDASLDNGCLWYVPGSQKEKTSLRLVRKTTETGGVTSVYEGQPPDNKPEEYVAIPVKKGSMVIIHGEVVHKSEQNHSEKSRNVYTFNFYDATDAAWSPNNWLQTEKPLSTLY